MRNKHGLVRQGRVFVECIVTGVPLPRWYSFTAKDVDVEARWVALRCAKRRCARPSVTIRRVYVRHAAVPPA